MTLAIPHEIELAVKELSVRSGVASERLLIDALLAHFPSIPVELQDELVAWELAADQDMLFLNKAHGLTEHAARRSLVRHASLPR